MKVYIAGPMTGLPQNNFPAFDEAARRLREQGYEVVSPAELDDPADRDLALKDLPATKTWGDFLARDVKLIADTGIGAIVLLPGWDKSRGARLEATVGMLCGLYFYELNGGWLSPPIGHYFVARQIAGTFI
jgi:Domain of unknown function (DUF4406)